MVMERTLHEDLSRSEQITVGSNRNFGFVIAAVFAIVCGVQLWLGSSLYWAWLLAAGVFAALAVLMPRVLQPLNILWFRFGISLHHIVTPMILGLMFFLVITPIGILLRVIGNRPLNLRFDRGSRTYWIPRDPPGPPPESFPNQF